MLKSSRPDKEGQHRGCTRCKRDDGAAMVAGREMRARFAQLPLRRLVHGPRPGRYSAYLPSDPIRQGPTGRPGHEMSCIRALPMPDGLFVDVIYKRFEHGTSTTNLISTHTTNITSITRSHSTPQASSSSILVGFDGFCIPTVEFFELLLQSRPMC